MKHIVFSVLPILFLVRFVARAADPATTARGPAEELASFHLADPQLSVELVAAEPDVISPVCIAWDADGRLFVVEMSDYPNTSDKGRAKLLEDRDGDGRYERVSIFADGLPFPNSVLPWNGGVLVTSAPDIWFFKDTDGDGRADERRVLFTGFGEGNQQLRVNGLRWGLDNWVYGANGRSDGEVRRADDPPGKTISIRRRDFRFRPDTLEFEAIAGPSQFGCAADDWGNRFLSWNTIPIRHVVIEERYLNRNPYLPSPNSLQDCLPRDDTQEVFPLTPPPLVFNEESSSHFNALAGLTIYRGDALGSDPSGREYHGNAFMGESLRNLVHRRILDPKGPTFVAKRGEQGKEFLGSTDPWFHPVNFATGPDGALYIIDFYRRFVEHPNYVHDPSMTNKMPWRMGADHGRIWQVHRKGETITRTKPRPKLSQKPTSELVQHLTSENGWWRDTAQRLLVERKDQNVAGTLRKLALDQGMKPASVHALWTLDALGLLDTDTLMSALNKSSSAGLLSSALRLAEPRLAEEERVLAAVLALADQRDSAANLQLALSLGEIKSTEKRDRRYAALGILPPTDEWHQQAILSSMYDRPWFGLRSYLTGGSPDIKARRTESSFLERLAFLVGANHNEADLNDCIDLLTSAPPPVETAVPILAGLAEGMARSNRSFREWLGQTRVHSKAQHDAVIALIQRAADMAHDLSLSVPLRIASVRLLSRAEPAVSRMAILSLVSSNSRSELQVATIQAVIRLNDPELTTAVFSNWPRFGPGTRRQLLAGSPQSPAAASALLQAVRDARIAPLEIPPGTRSELQRLSDSELRRAFIELLKNAAGADRGEVVQRFTPALKLDGDQKRGAEIFSRSCLICHTMKGRGAQVGPDLSSVGTRPKETLLVDVLDPSRAVSQDSLSYTIETIEGEIVTGLITAETATQITIRRAQQPDETIPRPRIKTIKADGKSLMPDGLEQGWSELDCADLLEFLRKPDANLLPESK